jgi:2-methylcitrate dehydratase
MLNPTPQVEDQTNTASLIVALADYARGFAIDNDAAIRTARHCLIDALGGGLAALREPESTALIGPLVPGCLMPGGARVPGTSLELDPAQAAFCTTLMLCRAASHGTWLRSGGAFGALLAVADYQGRKAIMEGKSPPKVRDMLAAMIRTVEIEGVLATGGATVRSARIAVTTVVTAQLGGGPGQIASALGYACSDGGMQTGAEDRSDIGYDDRAGKWASEWARADAIGRAVRHACQALAAGSAYLTHPAAMDLAGKRLCAGSRNPGKSFGTAIIDQLALPGPAEVAELTRRFHSAVDRHFPARQSERIKTLFAAPERLDDLPVNELLAVLVTNGAR